MNAANSFPPSARLAPESVTKDSVVPVTEVAPETTEPIVAAQTALPGDTWRSAQATGGLRARALAVGIPLLIAICMLSSYADMVAQQVQLGVLQLAPPAIAALFGLALVNQLLLRVSRREWLSRTDILSIYTMLLIGVMVSTRGVMEKLIPPLAYLPYYATRENKLNDLITQHLPAWALPFTPAAAVSPVPDSIRTFHEGMSKGDAIPWGIWIGPLLCWFALLCCILLVFACLATLLRRQWVDNEQLRFPLTTLPLAMIRNDVEGRPFFSDRTMWMGVAVAACVFSLNGLQANFPAWPGFVLDLNLKPLFSERPWNQMSNITLPVSLAAVGFAYFLPADLLFSLWFFFLLTRAQDIAAVQMGGVPASIVTHNARVWTGYQAMGAYLVLVLAQVRIGWPYFRLVWKTAIARRPEDKLLDDSNEMMSYRAAVTGLVLGFGGIIVWLALAGMNPLLAAAQMGIYIFLIALIMSRGVAEAGLLMTETSFLPTHLIGMVYPLPALGAANMSLVGLTNGMFIRDLRGILLSPLLDSEKMASELGVRQRSLLLTLAIAVVVSFVVSCAYFLYLNYTHGALSLYPNATNNAANMFSFARGALKGANPPDATAYGGLAVGVVVTTALVWMRSLYSWFPLNPLAYALAPTYSMDRLWFAMFLAWVVKSLVVRFGGIEMFRRWMPFMLGLILGEFMMAVFWALMNMYLGWSVPKFPV